MRFSPRGIAAGASVIVAACMSAPTPVETQGAAALNTLTSAERQAGWTLLFDGRTIDRWRGYGTQSVPPGWVIADGALTRAQPAVDLVSVEEFANFELAFEWKISPAGNSGIMFRVVEGADPPYYSGPEMQILDNGGHADGQAPETSAGSNYALHAPTKDLTRPVGAWNAARLIVNQSHVEHWLNGEKIVEDQLGSPDWVARVAGSKFSAWPPYGKAATGRLVLQDHGDVVAFRNIKIRKLQ